MVAESGATVYARWNSMIQNSESRSDESHPTCHFGEEDVLVLCDIWVVHEGREAGAVPVSSVRVPSEAPVFKHLPRHVKHTCRERKTWEPGGFVIGSGTAAHCMTQRFLRLPSSQSVSASGLYYHNVCIRARMENRVTRSRQSGGGVELTDFHMQISRGHFLFALFHLVARFELVSKLEPKQRAIFSHSHLLWWWDMPVWLYLWIYWNCSSVASWCSLSRICTIWTWYGRWVSLLKCICSSQSHRPIAPQSYPQSNLNPTQIPTSPTWSRASLSLSVESERDLEH